MGCRCKICGRPIDCGDVVCPRCEEDNPTMAELLKPCNGDHCEVKTFGGIDAAKLTEEIFRQMGME